MAPDPFDHPAWTALLQARDLVLAGADRFVLAARDSVWSACRTVPDDAEQVLLAHDGSRGYDLAGCAATRQSVLTWRPGAAPAVAHPTGRPCDPALLAMARVYVPVLLGTASARARGDVFVAGHVTQSLDGRIACANGQSQWIGNLADRHHAHRMRALCDAVMVGARTALVDDPQLTVRHVSGPQPRRVVVSGGGRVLAAAPPLRVFAPPGCLVLVASSCTAPPPAAEVCVVSVAGDGSALHPAAIRSTLASHGQHSVYLEGGATTLSSFLGAGAIDLLQVHVAPLVLGSGLAGVQLPPIEHVAHGIAFAMDHAALDGDMLLSCWPKRPPGAGNR
jgi:5-amino-6-(5-phosphoribosylamino)uracil reductase/diaminohydroxyphosphoribosylaminopyrimidine deaminase/5-amino-6-(5-phosphoribosylamino)uracil reductase